MMFVISMSCVKDRPEPIEYSYDYKDGPKAYIIHEGNYGSGNSSLSYFHLKETILNHFIYRSTNNGEILGDVFQSMYIDLEGRMYLSINNSHQLIVCDARSMIKSHHIPMYSPRYIQSVSPYKIYVSSLYSPFIYVLNTVSQQVEDTIIMPYNNVEQMCLSSDRVYVTGWDTAQNHIYVINPRLDTIEDSIFIDAKAPQSVWEDKYGQLWVFSGNANQGVDHKLTVINPETKDIIVSWTAPNGLEWIKPCMNSKKDRIFWLALDYGLTSENSGVISIAVDDMYLPTKPYIPAQRWQYFYGIGWNHINNELWVGDPKSFSEKSEIYIFDESGRLKDSFETQLGVGGFYFVTE